MPKLKPSTDLAYLAALLDLTCYMDEARKRIRIRHAGCAVIFHAAFGGTINAAGWTASGEQARACLVALRPYLKAKRRRAKAFLLG